VAITRIGQYPFEMNYPQSPAQSDRGLYQRAGDIYTFLEGDTEPFTGDRSLQFDSRADDGFGWPIPGAADDLRCGWFWNAKFGTSTSIYIKLEESDNTTPLLAVRQDNDKQIIELMVNGAVVQQANWIDFPHFMDSRGVYCHHGFHVIGGSRFVYTIDGESVLDYTDVSVPTAYEYMWLMESLSWGITNYIDDVYLEDVAGESYAVPPSYRYFPSLVDADGGTQGWAGYPNSGNDYEKVDDPGVDDEDTYVWIGAAGAVEMFDTSAISADVAPLGIYTFVSAIPWCLARKRDVSKASQIRMKADDGVAITSGSDQNLPGFYAEVWDRFLLDPQSNTWTVGNFDACEFGFESRGTI
jgi:hypothetical protein